jgi:SAM-dependent methyltransferase
MNRTTVIGGVPLPDPCTMRAIIPGSLIGEWLARQGESVRGALLDIGAGNQPYRPWYEQLADSCTATDVEVSPGVSVLAIGDRLPFRDATFDTVLCTEVLEHVPDAAAVVAELTRVLRPGGAVLVTVPFLYPVHEAPHDYQRFTAFGLRSVLERNGLQVESLVAKGGAAELIAHAVLGGATRAAATPKLRRRLPAAAASAVDRCLVAAQKSVLRASTPERRFAHRGRMSLGYMALARKPRA